MKKSDPGTSTNYLQYSRLWFEKGEGRSVGVRRGAVIYFGIFCEIVKIRANYLENVAN